MAQVAALKEELERSAARLEQISRPCWIVLAVPNLPHESVPVGADEHGNRKCVNGDAAPHGFSVRDHVDIGEKLGLDSGWVKSRLALTVMKGARTAASRLSSHAGWQTQEQAYECYVPYS